MNEIEIKIKVRFSDPLNDNRRVVKSIFDAVIDQHLSVGLAHVDEEAYTERITVESGNARHTWDIDNDVPFPPPRSILRSTAKQNVSDSVMDMNRSAIDSALEVLLSGSVTPSDAVAVCLILLEAIAGTRDEQSFNEELHAYSLDRLVQAGPSSGAYSAIFIDDVR